MASERDANGLASGFVRRPVGFRACFFRGCQFDSALVPLSLSAIAPLRARFGLSVRLAFSLLVGFTLALGVCFLTFVSFGSGGFFRSCLLLAIWPVAIRVPIVLVERLASPCAVSSG